MSEVPPFDTTAPEKPDTCAMTQSAMPLADQAVRIAMAHAESRDRSLDGIGVPWRYQVPACYVSMLRAVSCRKAATTGVPKRYRHLSKVSKRCPARTVRHPKVIKGACHVPGPIRELTSLSYTTMLHGPCTAPLTRS